MTTLYVDNIAPNLQSKISAPNLTLPTGSVIQVKSDTSTTQTNTSSTSYGDTQLSVSITPTSSSSKVFVMMYCSVRADQITGAGGHVRVMRDNTQIGEQKYMGWNNAAHYGQDTSHMEILDSPATTSAVTYKVQVRTQTAGQTINFGHDNGLQGITVKEIAG